MNILILSCNTGQGHNSVATAVKEKMELRGVSCQVEDALGFISKSASDFISKWHVRIYRYIPRLFGFGYKFTEKHASVFGEKTVIYRLLSQGSDKLFEFIKSGGYDAVVCTHVFAAIMITNISKKYELDIKTYFVSTDYTCHPGTQQSELNGYFIPDDSLAGEFERSGIYPERLTTSGIPVRQRFYHSVDKKEAKRRVGVGEENRHLLMMCGSMGCGPMKKLAKVISGELSTDSELTVVCGTNKRLYKRLSRSIGEKHNIHIRGYVDNIDLLMDSADLYLTKPGGISTSEAVAKGLPMVLIDAVAGCEEHNMKFFINKGAAVTARGAENLSRLCIELLEDDEATRRMEEALEIVDNGDGSDIIYKHIANEIENEVRYEREISNS